MQLKPLLCSIVLLFSGYGFAQSPVEVVYKDYQISRSLQQDSNIVKMLQPYADSMLKQMKTVIGFSNAYLYKKQPECALGNLMADCMKEYAAKAFQTTVDAAIVNFGGIRSYLPKGDIKMETVYELMPFDNLIVVQKINGNLLHQLLDLIAYKGGWPCAGITMKIKDKVATDVTINGLPLNDTAVYAIAVPDFLANGGDGCTMLKGIAKQNKNYLYRDALIEYITSFTRAGKPVSATIENRIVNVTD